MTYIQNKTEQTKIMPEMKAKLLQVKSASSLMKVSSAVLRRDKACYYDTVTLCFCWLSTSVNIRKPYCLNYDYIYSSRM